MSKRDEDCPITEKLCGARRELIIEKIEGLKKTIYVTSVAITFVIVVVQSILNFWR